MAEIKFTFDAKGVTQILRSPAGPVGKYMLKLGRMTEAEAKRLASGVLVKVDTGRLAGQINHRLGVSSKGLFVEIGSNVEYAIYVHDGTKAHTIRPKRAKVLRFPSGGGIVYATVVNHPGTKPRPYLLNAMNTVVKQN